MLSHFHLHLWFIPFVAGSDVMVKLRLVFDNRLHICGRSEISQNSDRFYSKKEMCVTWHSYLQSTALPCMYTLAPAVMQLLEAPLELLLWHSCDTCCYILLKFFCGWRMMSLDHCVHCHEEPDIAQSKIWSIWWWWWWGGGVQVPELVYNFDIKSRVHVLQTLTTFSLFLDVAGLLLHSSFTDSWSFLRWILEECHLYQSQ